MRSRLFLRPIHIPQLKKSYWGNTAHKLKDSTPFDMFRLRFHSQPNPDPGIVNERRNWPLKPCTCSEKSFSSPHFVNRLDYILSFDEKHLRTPSIHLELKRIINEKNWVIFERVTSNSICELKLRFIILDSSVSSWIYFWNNLLISQELLAWPHFVPYFTSSLTIWSRHSNRFSENRETYFLFTTVMVY